MNKTVTIDANNALDNLQSIQRQIGGQIKQTKSQYVLTINNKTAKGVIKANAFDRGLRLLEYDITFREAVELSIDGDQIAPIYFYYFAQGFGYHQINEQNQFKIEQYRSVITSPQEDVTCFLSFPANQKIHLTELQIHKQQFLNKQGLALNQLEDNLYEVFVDKDCRNNFLYYGAFDLSLLDKVTMLNEDIAVGGSLVNHLYKEGIVYQILADHLRIYRSSSKNQDLETSLLKKELKKIKELSISIANDVSRDYCLDALSEETGLPQAKLQEGFKLLYDMTVTEYIRHLRLEEAKSLMNDSDLNISEIVYSIGFSSRSYFSKIFKEKYSISPNEYKNKVFQPSKLNAVKSTSLEVVA
ncbi:helix-turn-helix domain-containing protein [Aquimarina brevivitae]|uniref:AraC family transcriptional regulator n=1 Tax=Aquimarina brevivitae TaxID=323412 RepID=A0A4Q7PHL4_9FLAO|nr:AraC family transcriptional regulator [Aquimarina brevivitae]RZT00047.1 AraC family transcriptional regulator [Aquimarina brevivitae]